MNKTSDLLKKQILILDGATGTELQKRGMPAGVCPEIWCLENPRVIQEVHSDYQSAGANIIYTCTFGANRLKLSQYGRYNTTDVNKHLAIIAKKAVGNKTLIAGDIGSTGKFIEPFGALAFEEAVTIFKEQVKGLLDGGVDLFVIETMMDIQEARAALLAVKELTDKFTIVTMTYEKNGRTLNGTDPLSALITLQSLGADAVGCNCSTGPKDILPFIEAMKPYATVPLVAKPNAGMPKLIDGKTCFDMGASEFASYGQEFVAKGVNLIGGCCGTTPEHIKQLKANIGPAKPVMPLKKSISALSSARKSVILGSKRPSFLIVGESINPTGRKQLQEELRQGKFSLLRQLAKDQEKSGANLLDVNVGVVGIDEVKTMKQAINLLSTGTELPLVIDSSNPTVTETALRLYPGRALINSISGEKEKLKKLLPLAKKYGAMFILLPLGQKDIPKTFPERQKNIQSIFTEAQKLGFTKDDIVVDGITMAVSSLPGSALETLKTISWVAKTFKANTILGLSNISFGLPNRALINITFMALARKEGLTMAIANPAILYNSSIIAPLSLKKAKDVLLNNDKDALNYIAHVKKTVTPVKKDLKTLSPEEKVSAAVLEGNREDIKGFLQEALKSGVAPDKLVNQVMIPAINKVGDLFDKKEYFLPQLIASAEAMEIGFAYLEPHLKKKPAGTASPTVVLLATVKGDIHDIGKNIVALMLKNHGFKVIDLGKDVSAEKIIAAVKKHKAPIVGLSALMTTTMVNMKEVIDLAKKEGLKCRFILGGAVVSEEYARSLGAEYSKDGVEAVRVVKKLSGAGN
jgi:5-methyltetrahydrofolate--homocysteine methyltransferase